jgi:hypothetical protein
LSASSRRAAAVDDADFEIIVAGARDKIKSGGAILVDPVKAAAKTAELDDAAPRMPRARSMAARSRISARWCARAASSARSAPIRSGNS